MIKAIVRKFRRTKLMKRKPKMIWGYKRLSDGVLLPRTRISSSTFLDNELNLFIEDNVFIGHFNFIEASNNLTIETGCQITNYVNITTHSSHNSIRLYGDDYAGDEMIGYVKGSVHIGKFTFIGPHSTIMPGTKIGKGSIVSAYSYVKGEFPDFSIISGNPAQKIGDTRDADTKVFQEHPKLQENYNKWAEG
jgi:acetyltransferase-like isoleucine patch superfamily enzyme